VRRRTPDTPRHAPRGLRAGGGGGGGVPAVAVVPVAGPGPGGAAHARAREHRRVAADRGAVARVSERRSGACACTGGRRRGPNRCRGRRTPRPGPRRGHAGAGPAAAPPGRQQPGAWWRVESEAPRVRCPAILLWVPPCAPSHVSPASCNAHCDPLAPQCPSASLGIMHAPLNASPPPAPGRGTSTARPRTATRVSSRTCPSRTSALLPSLPCPCASCTSMGAPGR